MEFTDIEIKILKAALYEFEWAVKATFFDWDINDIESADIVKEIKALQDKLAIY